MATRSVHVTQIAVDGRALNLAAATLYVPRDRLAGEEERHWSMTAFLNIADWRLRPAMYDVEIVTADSTRRRGKAILARVQGHALDFRGSGELDPTVD